MDVFKFSFRLFQNFSLGGLILFVPEECSNVLEGILEDSKNVVNSSSIFDGLSEELGVSRLEYDVSIDGGRLSELEISIDKVGQVGEIKAEAELILTVPLIPLGVENIFNFSSSVCCQESWKLSKASDLPISQCDFGHCVLVDNYNKKDLCDCIYNNTSEKYKLYLTHIFLLSLCGH